MKTKIKSGTQIWLIYPTQFMVLKLILNLSLFFNFSVILLNLTNFTNFYEIRTHTEIKEVQYRENWYRLLVVGGDLVWKMFRGKKNVYFWNFLAWKIFGLGWDGVLSEIFQKIVQKNRQNSFSWKGSRIHTSKAISQTWCVLKHPTAHLLYI